MIIGSGGKRRSMSRVRYVNKNTGWVSIYESVSHYDPLTKTSRPKRTYIGYEDPVTGEFVPSSGRPGRKKRQNSDPEGSKPSKGQYYDEYKRAVTEIEKQREENRQLTAKIQSLNRKLEEIYDAVTVLSSSIATVKESSSR